MFCKGFYFSFFISLAIVAGAMFFAEKGIKDLSRLVSEIRETEIHIRQLEKSNESLQRKIKLLEAADPRFLEDRIRSEYGLVHAGEWVYLEPSKPSF